MRVIGYTVIAILGAACGGEASGPKEDTRPTAVVITSFAALSGGSSSRTVDLGLKNNGGAGTYYVRYHLIGSVNVPGVPNPPWVWVSSQSVEVAANWSGSLRYSVNNTANGQVLGEVEVYSQSASGGGYTRTDCRGC